MIIILPAVFFAIWYLAAKKEKDLMEGLVVTQLVYHTCILVITNLWSIPELLNAGTVFFSWLAILGTVLFLLFRNTKREKRRSIEGEEEKQETPVKNGWIRDARQFLNETGICGKLMLAMTGLLFLVLLFGAVFTVPYNYDSMTYHLGRIAHWIDNASVNHYVTNIDRQIYSPVLSEYEMLHMWLLAGNDWFLNLLQYVSMIFTGMILYRTALKIGTDRKFSLLAAFLFYTMPLTISQSITTQNDLLGAMWFAIFLYYLVDFVKLPQITFDKEQRKKLLCVGASVAFAFLTKTSVCASMLFFMPWFVIVCLKRKDKFGKLLESAALAGVTLTVLISETLIRTYLSCGHLMADTTSSNIMVATKNVKYIVVNILKNFSLLITQHLIRPLNGVIYRFAIGVGTILQVDFNNEAIAYHGFDFLHHMNMGEDMYSHDKTPSAVVAYLALLAGVVMIVAVVAALLGKRRRAEQSESKPEGRKSGGQDATERRTAALWYEYLSVGFIVSSWLSLGFIMALLRWQPWGSRLMYPALAMMVVTIANAAGAVFAGRRKEAGKKDWKSESGCIILIVLSALFCIRPAIYNLQPAIENVQAGCKNRQSRYFRFNDRYTPYKQLIAKTEELGLKNIGLSISGDGYDYPLWLMYRETDRDVRLYHVILDEDCRNGADVGEPLSDSTASGKQGQKNAPSLLPDCILYVEHGKLSEGECLTYQGTAYRCIYVSDVNPDAPDAVLVKE